MADPKFFVILHGPNYPRAMVDDEDRLSLWNTPEEAKNAIKAHAAVRAFGAEIFELGTAEDEV